MCRFDYVLTGTRGRSTKTGKLCRHGAFHVCGWLVLDFWKLISQSRRSESGSKTRRRKPLSEPASERQAGER